ncbi:MAG: polysaccharide pyruvyl transferase family protein [Synergistaceae bacterium]|nr:polysaccharide pyruvyl transferase family protein [Synergistaceae bacterium]
MKKWLVTLLGYYGFGNLGDELLALSAIKQLEKFGIPRDKIMVMTASPDFYSELGVGYVDRWNLRKIWSVLRESRTLLLGGGGIFQNVTSLRSCFYYWSIIKMASLAGAVPWAVSQSIGPFSGKLSRLLAKSALSKCKALEVRDESSKKMADELGLESEMGEDLVFGLSLNPELKSTGSHILVNFRAWKETDRFISAAGDYINSSELPCLGVAMSPDDLSFIDSARVKYKINFSDIVLVKNWDEARGLWSKAAEAIGIRLHFSLISLLFGLKQMLYAYDPKVLCFAERWGIPVWNDKDALVKPEAASVSIENVRGMVTSNFSRCAKKVVNL